MFTSHGLGAVICFRCEKRIKRSRSPPSLVTCLGKFTNRVNKMSFDLSSALGQEDEVKKKDAQKDEFNLPWQKKKEMEGGKSDKKHKSDKGDKSDKKHKSDKEDKSDKKHKSEKSKDKDGKDHKMKPKKKKEKKEGKKSGSSSSSSSDEE
ncbi:uncharacterized protein DDB_G0288629 isoform X2 [Perca flavescens]|uniref:uncharacterized protein DDB_G0288629 isoform X2 n=1 Tax=Perca flavescens TaxID=8167 RepID=UPI00106E6CF7|nr:uncharacterized protein DDB_G0288629-like isoform X2 [Perca flavescens]